MPATRIHLVRHGEVHNPEGVLYGRLPNFSLSDRGEQMAALAAKELKDSGAKVSRILASPLMRTMQSAKPISEQFNVPIEVEEDLIEPTNIFEGHVVGFQTLYKNPGFLLKLYNPLTPSWGEPFKQIASRVTEAMQRAWNETPSGEVVMVSHQLTIWMAHRHSKGLALHHDPRKRRCDLSSITSFEFTNEGLKELDYRDPALELRVMAQDVGAV
jgi:broad specificity phosphatase PhoE